MIDIFWAIINKRANKICELSFNSSHLMSASSQRREMFIRDKIYYIKIDIKYKDNTLKKIFQLIFRKILYRIDSLLYIWSDACCKVRINSILFECQKKHKKWEVTKTIRNYRKHYYLFNNGRGTIVTQTMEETISVLDEMLNNCYYTV